MPAPRSVRDENVSIPDLGRFGEDRGSPVHVLEPVAGGRGGEEMAAKLGEEMARHFYAVRVGEGGGAQPSGDAADALDIRHDVVQRLERDGVGHLEGVDQVLADLDRRLQLGADAREADLVVVPHRLFDPIESLVVEHAPAQERFAYAQALI